MRCGTRRGGAAARVAGLALVAAVACSGGEPEAPPVEEPVPQPGAPGRLLLADRERPVVHVVDLGNGLPVGTLDLVSPATLVPGSRGFAYVVQAAADRIDALDPGRIDEDGVVEPRILRATVRGPRPRWLVANAGVATAFFAGDGSVAWWREADVGQPSFEAASRDVGPAHDGIALAFGEDALIVSHPGDDEAPTPPSLDLWSRTAADGRQERFAGCAEPRSAVGGRAAVAVGCRDLVYYVRVDPDTGAVTGEPLGVPIFDGGARVDRLRLDPSEELLVGTYGDDTLLRIEPPEVARIQLPNDVLDLRFVGEGTLLAILLDGGALIEADALGGPTGRAVRVFGEARSEDLTMVVGRDAIFVADAATGRVAEIPTDTWLPARWLRVDGHPASGLAFPGTRP